MIMIITNVVHFSVNGLDTSTWKAGLFLSTGSIKNQNHFIV